MAGTVIVRLFASARAALGTARLELAVAEGDTIDSLLRALLTEPTLAPDRGAGAERVLARCSFLRNGITADRDTALVPGDTVDALPPFAGG
ncbi:MoaD/ThiS family protein [Galbitalea soli]|uniref:MoaD/ThiS family protein n=1 Tax=Galbitalea soli TaxID=1268042 RepID=A0A7C9PMI5_9MICO|nr:MoaD/ThiS family protein [Galbitalea soli]NEM90768.1 MoaD/ThiS family protein [Galbitalea soli]NYJ31486.1 molybdopterin converting factor small subunit [Galbitalea soli]